MTDHPPRAPRVVQVTEPGVVEVVAEERAEVGAGQVRVATLYSGVSAGTELTAFRGSNAYVNRQWDPQARLFVPGEPTFSYPVVGWGYSEVGRVVEVAADVQQAPPVGALVYGAWGHRSEAVVARDRIDGVLPGDVDPVAGTFVRVGAIALNAVLAARLHLGTRVAIVGQGVLGLLATRLAVLSGAEVVAVDGNDLRLRVAGQFGASRVVDIGDGPSPEQVKQHGASAVDVVIEFSGTTAGLRDAIRMAPPDGRVVAAGFYQGGADDVRLGDEFHHNRVRVVASQIGHLPPELRHQWNRRRLNDVVVEVMADGRLDVEALVSHVVPVGQVADLFGWLDAGRADVLQAVLSFPDTDVPANEES